MSSHVGRTASALAAVGRWRRATAFAAALCTGCSPVAQLGDDRCQTSYDCAEGRVCFEGYCRKTCNVTLDCASDESCVNGVCLRKIDDGGRSDQVGRDAAVVGDAWRSDGNRPDRIALDSAGCVAQFGQPCTRTGYCGAAYDCAGLCVGGSAPDPCPQCGSRVCEGSNQWSACQDDPARRCGFNSTCTTSGQCACTVDDCEAVFCYENAVYGCSVDSFGCGSRGSLIEACTGSDPCTNYYCSGNACAESEKEDGESCGGGYVCSNGLCCSPDQGDPCGTRCDCDTYHGNCSGIHYTGYTVCDGSCLEWASDCYEVCLGC
ncbi:MAG: hypothetical protein JXR83_22385 [Deltaproteobacteria bacterium]|nr:hypothetical protein [Deltaproteobacteria bacterium]